MKLEYNIKTKVLYENKEAGIVISELWFEGDDEVYLE
jgi:hypothetical protein